jgi:hypothetical protein
MLILPARNMDGELRQAEIPDLHWVRPVLGRLEYTGVEQLE